MKNPTISIIGLGYVGLPLSVVFSQKYRVTGYDNNNDRVNQLNNFIDKTNEIESKEIEKCLNENLIITSDLKLIKYADIYIITVPTPIDNNKNPDLTILKNATKMVGGLIKKQNIIIFESTVFPGCTEEVCVPILEQESKLKYNVDFYCGYSPERVNPGDREHTIDKIVKVTSGSDKSTSEIIDKLYSSAISAGTYMAPSIKVAEAAKVIENTQRDINIAFINELARIFSKMNIDTNEVLDAASTKWNFLNFRPGLVGGHCIGVDPYYLANKAKEIGYHPEIILAGRNVNDDMGIFVSNQIIELVKNSSEKVNSALILGATFKENCPDYRNTKVLDIFNTLSNNNINPDIYDPWINKKTFKEEFNISIHNELPRKKYNIIILAVAHECFKNMDLNKLKSKTFNIVYDLKGFLNKNNVTKRL